MPHTNIISVNFRFYILLVILLFAFSCSSKQDISQYGKLTFYNTDQKTFSFTISDEFIKSHATSAPDKSYPKMTKAEMTLLIKFLKNNNYCINKNGKLSFVITSKQEKIYDMTFSSLIEQNYNAKPVMPTTYFGTCN